MIASVESERNREGVGSLKTGKCEWSPKGAGGWMDH